jgi:hypothetical protein
MPRIRVKRMPGKVREVVKLGVEDARLGHEDVR